MTVSDLQPETEARSVATSRRIRGLLAENRIAASALAPRVGLTQQTFSRRLVGLSAFSVDELDAIATELEVSLGWLLGLEKDAAPRVNREGLGRGASVRHQGLEPRTR